MIGRRESVDKESSNYVPSIYVFHRVVVTLSSSSSRLLGKSRKLDGKLLIEDVDQRSTIAQFYPFFLAEGLVLDHAGVKLLQDLLLALHSAAISFGHSLAPKFTSVVF